MNLQAEIAMREAGKPGMSDEEVNETKNGSKVAVVTCL